MSAERNGIYEAKVIGISGGDGAGKGYLSSYVAEKLDMGFVPMTTTRPSRGECDDKKCICEEEYRQLVRDGQIVGNHRNNGHLYGFHTADIQQIDRHSFIEINPALQSRIDRELREQGIELVGWIGVTGELTYLEQNMRSRDKEATEDRIQKKLVMADTIMQEIQKMYSNEDGPITVLFEVGWHNRDTMAEEFEEVVKGILQD